MQRDPKNLDLSVHAKYVKRLPHKQSNYQEAHSLMLDTSNKDADSVGTNSILNSPLITRKIQNTKKFKTNFQKFMSPPN